MTVLGDRRVRVDVVPRPLGDLEGGERLSVFNTGESFAGELKIKEPEWIKAVREKKTGGAGAGSKGGARAPMRESSGLVSALFVLRERWLNKCVRFGPAYAYSESYCTAVRLRWADRQARRSSRDGRSDEDGTLSLCTLPAEPSSRLKGCGIFSGARVACTSRRCDRERSCEGGRACQGRGSAGAVC